MKPICLHLGQQDLQRTSLIALLGCLLIGLSATLASWVMAQWLPAPADSSALLVPTARALLAPEPVERVVFLSGLLVAPPLLLALISGLKPSTAKAKRWGNDRLELLLSILLATLLLLPLPLSPAIRASIGPAGFSEAESWWHGLKALLLALSTLVFTRLARQYRWSLHPRQRHVLQTAALGVSVMGVGFGLVIFRIFRFGRISESAVWSDHLDAVVASIATVNAGGTLLVDAPSQYGLFAELVTPCLKFFAHGIEGVTLIFALLEILAIATLLNTLKRRLHSPWVLLCTGLALAMLTFGLHTLSGIRFSEPDPIFQIWPIRFIGPAFAVPLSFWILTKPSWIRIALLGIYTGLCLFWNLDSGAAVLYAESMTLLLLSGLACANQTALASWKWPKLLAASLALPIISATALTACLLSLSLKAGEPIQLQWLTSFQRTFYEIGFGMLPLPGWPDAWYSIVGCYCIALVIGLIGLQDRRPLRHCLPLIYLPLLGAGLLTYYQGRSHFFNLISVSWPAVIVTGLLVDRHWIGLRRSLLAPVSSGLAIAGLTFLWLPASALLSSLPTLFAEAKQTRMNQPQNWQSQTTSINSELKMVKAFCTDRQAPCLILTKRQGIYALEANTASAWKGPAPAEMLLQADRDRLLTAIRNGVPKRILLGIGPNSYLNQLGIHSADVTRHYRVAAANREHTMLLLLPQAAKGASR